MFAREVCRAARYWTLELGKNFTPGGTRPDSIDSGHLVFSTFAKHLEELIVIEEFAIVFHPDISEGHRILFIFRSMFSAGGVNAVQRENTCWGRGGEGLGKWELGVTCHVHVVTGRRGATIVRKGLRK